MSSKISKSKRQPGGALVEALMNIIEPYNHHINNDPLRATEADLDTGHVKPSNRDKTFAFMMARLAQNAHDQLFNQIKGKDGVEYDSASTRVEKARARQVGVVQSYYNPMLTSEENGMALRSNTDYIKACYWLDAATLKAEALDEILQAAASVYYFLTGETWKPLSQQPVTKKTIDEKMLAEAMASAAKHEARARSLASR